jgi:3-methyladenine DNA glycosylase AlkD
MQEGQIYMENTYIQNALLLMRDLKYLEFNAGLIPTVSKDTMIGIRTPKLREFAKQLNVTPDASRFLSQLPHKYYEENNLHGLLINLIRDFNEAVSLLDIFLPYVDNWATCDIISPKSFNIHPKELPDKILQWINSDHTYTVRFGTGVLMSWYLDEYFDPKYPKLVSAIQSEEYYINMMRAWYFATALAKQYDIVIKFFENHMLDAWTHNKSIQKAIESRRISQETKLYLRSLKV